MKAETKRPESMPFLMDQKCFRPTRNLGKPYQSQGMNR